MADNEVHPQLALELVQNLRTRGGFWRLVQTALVTTSPLFLLLTFSEASPLGVLISSLATALLMRNLIQNARAGRAQHFLEDVARHGQPFAAVMDGRTLRIGRRDTDPQQWPALRISPNEERKLRHLALPAPRVVDD